MLTVSASWPGISSAAYDTFNCGNMFVLIQPFRNLMEICNFGHMEKKNPLPSLISLLMVTKCYQLAKVKIICFRDKLSVLS